MKLTTIVHKLVAARAPDKTARVFWLPGKFMHTLILPLQARFIVFTLVVLIAAALGLEFFYGFRSLLIEIPLVVFISLAVVRELHCAPRAD